MTLSNSPQVLCLTGDVRHLYPGDAVHPRQVHPHSLPHLPSVHHPVSGDNWSVLSVVLITFNLGVECGRASDGVAAVACHPACSARPEPGERMVEISRPKVFPNIARAK